MAAIIVNGTDTGLEDEAALRFVSYLQVSDWESIETLSPVVPAPAMACGPPPAAPWSSGPGGVDPIGVTLELECQGPRPDPGIDAGIP